MAFHCRFCCTFKLPLSSSRLRFYHSSVNTFNFLRLIKRSRSSQDLKPLCSLLTVHGLESNEFFVAEFLRACFRLGLPRLALSAFRRIEKPRLCLQNLMIRCLCKCGLYGDVLGVCFRCRVSGFFADEFTFPSVIKSCAALGDESTGKQIHCVCLRTGFEKSLVVQTALVDFYAKCGRLRDARHMLDRIPQPDLVAFNALIAGYSFNGYDREAVEVFRGGFAAGLKANMSTLSSMIPVCSRLGWTKSSKSLHGFSMKSGYLVSCFLVPALISMYTRDMDLSSARNLFDSVWPKNVSVWNSMISAYTQMKIPIDASVMFRTMLRNNIQPDLITYVSIIPSCENFDSKSLGESLHASAIKQGFENQLPVSTALLVMYARLGKVDSADYIFYRMNYRNRLSWSSLISGYVYNARWESSLAAFREMQFAGFDPDEFSIITVVSACSKLDALLLGQSLHAFSLRKGFDSIVNVSNALLAFYAGFQISSCFKLFHEMTSRSTVSWNTLISCCVHSKKIEMVGTVLRNMQKDGVEMDLVTLTSILPIFSESKTTGQGMAFHCYAIKSGFSRDVSLVNALISMYCSCGDLESGKFLFENMPEKCEVTWNAMLTGLRDHGLHEDVMDLFGRMIKDGKTAYPVALLSLLPSCDSLLQGKSVHGFAIRTGIIQEAPLLTSLIFMYLKFDNIRSCLSLFRIGRKEDISLWNAIMSVHTETKNPRNAIALFCSLLEKGLEPDIFTLQSLISACIQLNNLKLADSVMSYLICKGLDKEVDITNALIDMYAKCGNILCSRKLFEQMKRKDDVSWRLMINGYGLHGDGKSALDLFSQMRKLGIKPDGIVYSMLLSSCSHSGLAEEGLRVFDSMVFPRAEHYACLVDLLARTGNLIEAYEIVKRMPFKPSSSLLETLLGGCIVYRNVEIGEEISRALFDLDPENSGPYVMLHNIYASVGRWSDAEKVRSEIEKRRLRKVPGFSLLVGDG